MAWLQTYISGTLQNWAHRLELTIDHTKIDEDLTDFPVMINLSSNSGYNDADMSYVLDSLTVSGTFAMSKIAITDLSGDNETYVEIDYFDYDNKKVVLWTKIPFVSSTTDTTFYLYYDNRVADNDTYVGYTGSSAGQNVWDNYYLSVYHMAQDPSSTTLLSSKSANADFVGSFVSMSSSSLVDGPLGKELTFDGSADYIDIPWKKRLGIQTLELTVEAFVNGGRGPLLSTQRTSSNAGDGNFVIQSDNVLYTVYAWQSTAPWNVYFRFYPDGFSTGELNYIGYAIGDHNIDMCVNSQTNSQTFDWSWSGSVVEYTDVRMFMHQNYTYNTNYFNGNCSEFRISSVPRSKAWMTATNYAVRDSLVTFPAAVYKATGVVTENTLPVVRTLRLYREVDGMLVAETTSNTEGYYELETPYTDAHYVVCMDSSGGANYNHLIKKDVELEPV